MNMAYYNLAFDRALDFVYDSLGIGFDFTANTNLSFFALEVHINYYQEVLLDDPLRVEVQLLDWDKKRLHISKMMYHDTKNYLAATCEQLSIHIDLTKRRSTVLSQDIQARIGALYEKHQNLAKPEHIGRTMGIRRD
jgi:acyl-CoA thioester hydrolase